PLANFPGAVLLAKHLAGTFPVLCDHLSGPPFDGRIVSETRRDPHLHNVPCLGSKSGDIIRIARRIERFAVKGVEDGEIARADVDFTDGVAIDGHPDSICALHLLVIAFAIAVEPTAHVPVELGMIAVVEDAEIASVDAAS